MSVSQTQPLTPVATVKQLLVNMANRDEIFRLVHPEATYISLAYTNPQLKRIMPWAGEYKGSGPKQFWSTFSRVASCWGQDDFGIDAAFGDGEDVAVFGNMTCVLFYPLRSALMGYL